MDASTVVDFGRQAILTTAVMVAPVLLVSLVVGITISLLQAVTQMQDQAISFVPKLIAVGAAVLLALPWMVEYFVSYFQEVMNQLPLSLLGS